MQPSHILGLGLPFHFSLMLAQQSRQFRLQVGWSGIVLGGWKIVHTSGYFSGCSMASPYFGPFSQAQHHLISNKITKRHWPAAILSHLPRLTFPAQVLLWNGIPSLNVCPPWTLLLDHTHERHFFRSALLILEVHCESRTGFDPSEFEPRSWLRR